LEHCAVGGERAEVAADDGVAVGRGAVGAGGAHRAGGARDILDDQRLAERLAHPLPGIADDRVGPAAGRGRYDDGDRGARIVSGLRLRSRGEYGAGGKSRDEEGGDRSQSWHRFLPRIVFSWREWLAQGELSAKAGRSAKPCRGALSRLVVRLHGIAERLE